MTTATAPAPATDEGTDVRDAAAIDGRDWPARPLVGPAAAGRDGRFQVVYRQSALDAIHLHGQTRTDVEVGGVLLGTGHRDEHGAYLLVEHAIAGTAASSRSTNVTFTADTWQQIQTVWDRDYPDKKMVGWYHTHPGFGIFLSDMDVFICDNFFNLSWQIAFVYDPLGGDEGNFVWRSGKPTREPVLLEDDVTPAAAAVPLMPLAEAMTGSDPAYAAATAAATAATTAAGPGLSAAVGWGAGLAPDTAEAVQSQVIELMTRVRRLERRIKLLGFAVLFLAVFVAVCVTMLVWTGVVSVSVGGGGAGVTPTTVPGTAGNVVPSPSRPASPPRSPAPPATPDVRGPVQGH